MWSNDMGILLRGKGLWEFVAGTAVQQEEAEAKQAFQRKRDIALANILMAITPCCKSTVITMRDPHQDWTKVSEMFQAVSEATVDSKLSKIQNIKKKPSESVMAYANRIEGLVNVRIVTRVVKRLLSFRFKFKLQHIIPPYVLLTTMVDKVVHHPWD